jgi:hypothetical protein
MSGSKDALLYIFPLPASFKEGRYDPWEIFLEQGSPHHLRGYHGSGKDQGNLLESPHFSLGLHTLHHKISRITAPGHSGP